MKIYLGDLLGVLGKESLSLSQETDRYWKSSRVRRAGEQNPPTTAEKIEQEDLDKAAAELSDRVAEFDKLRRRDGDSAQEDQVHHAPGRLHTLRPGQDPQGRRQASGTRPEDRSEENRNAQESDRGSLRGGRPANLHGPLGSQAGDRQEGRDGPLEGFREAIRRPLRDGRQDALGDSERGLCGRRLE